ncbi:MAG: ABC transporter transmembrane domain-containing protein [Deinococcota bacterium]
MIAKLLRRDEAEVAQFLRLVRYVRPYLRPFWIGMAGVTISSILGLALPLFTRRLFNIAFINENASVTQLNEVALGIFAIFLVQAGFNYLRVFMLALVGEGVVADLRRVLFGHLIDLPVRFFEARKTGEITSRLTSDITTLRGAVSGSLAQLLNQIIILLGGIVFLFVLNSRLTLVMLSVVPPVIVATAYFGRKLKKLSTEFQDRVADANASAEEAISGVRVVKSFTAEGLERNRYNTLIDTSYDVALRKARIRAIFVPAVLLGMFSSITIVLWYGGRLVFSGNLPAGDLIAFLMLTVFVAGSVGAFAGLYSQFQEALGASKRIFDLLDEHSDLPLADKPTSLTNIQGHVRFDKMSFNYGDRGDAPVLHNINLDAQPGEITALVGPSGAGKTTLVTLLPRFYDPTDGQILLDGQDLRELDLDNLRRAIGIVPQETQLFSGSIAENIRYGKPDAGDEDVIAAANAANAHDFISSFPDGYDTLVGERGVKLSGGQRQRIAIARAILKDPRILILDEATSALDNESEALVQDALEHLMQGRTTFVIAHRLSTVQNADRIVVLDDGEIVQVGSHESLLAKGGLYRELYDKQFRQRDLASNVLM